MTDSILKNILEKSIIQLPGNALVSLFSKECHDFITIKNTARVYEYTNTNWANLFGYKSNKDTLNRKDSEFCRDKQKVNIYHELDDQVFDTCLPNVVCEEIYPERNKLTKLVAGTMYPIMNDSGKPIAVLGIFHLKNQIWQLTLDLALNLSDEELDDLLVKRSYLVTVYHRTLSIAKREIQCLIGLMKGKHAGEIALSLNLKQSTIEFYIDNLKNKLGAVSKSSVINTAFEQKIIQQLEL